MTNPDPTRSATGSRRLAALVGTVLLVAACATPGTSPSAAPDTSAPGSDAPAATTSAAAGEPRWGMTPEEEAAWQEIEAAADAEGRFTYYSVGSVPADRVEELKAAFAEDYPNIQIDYLAAGNNAAVVARISTEQESGVYLGDASDFSYGNLAASDVAWFEEFVAPAAGNPDANWQFDPTLQLEGKPVSTAMMTQNFGFWINTDLVNPADAPQTYMDLTDPKWRGQIVYRQPWTTGGGNHTYRFAVEEYGDAWVQGMQAQELTFAADQDAALISVARGEYAIGAGLTGRQAARFIAEGEPLAVVWPEDIGVRVTNSIVIIKNAPHVNAAKVFANWMLTDRGQEFWRDLGQFPVNLNVAPAEAWMADFSRSAIQAENLATPDELEVLLETAQSQFQR